MGEEGEEGEEGRMRRDGVIERWRSLKGREMDS